MKSILVVAMVLVVTVMSTVAFARCDSPDDRAADGSRCGGRAASERPGGRP